MAKKKVKINLGNSLIVDNIRKLKESFDKQVSMAEALTVHSDEITQIDLSGVQLLHYIVNRCKTEGKELGFKLKISEEQQSILYKNGFSELIQTVL